MTFTDGLPPAADDLNDLLNALVPVFADVDDDPRTVEPGMARYITTTGLQLAHVIGWTDIGRVPGLHKDVAAPLTYAVPGQNYSVFFAKELELSARYSINGFLSVFSSALTSNGYFGFVGAACTITWQAVHVGPSTSALTKTGLGSWDGTPGDTSNRIQFGSNGLRMTLLDGQIVTDGSGDPLVSAAVHNGDGVSRNFDIAGSLNVERIG